MAFQLSSHSRTGYYYGGIVRELMVGAQTGLGWGLQRGRDYPGTAVWCQHLSSQSWHCQRAKPKAPEPSPAGSARALLRQEAGAGMLPTSLPPCHLIILSLQVLQEFCCTAGAPSSTLAVPKLLGWWSSAWELILTKSLSAVLDNGKHSPASCNCSLVCNFTLRGAPSTHRHPPQPAPSKGTHPSCFAPSCLLPSGCHGGAGPFLFLAGLSSLGAACSISGSPAVPCCVQCSRDRAHTSPVECHRITARSGGRSFSAQK